MAFLACSSPSVVDGDGPALLLLLRGHTSTTLLPGLMGAERVRAAPAQQRPPQRMTLRTTLPTPLRRRACAASPASITAPAFAWARGMLRKHTSLHRVCGPLPHDGLVAWAGWFLTSRYILPATGGSRDVTLRGSQNAPAGSSKNILLSRLGRCLHHVPHATALEQHWRTAQTATFPPTACQDGHLLPFSRAQLRAPPPL